MDALLAAGHDVLGWAVRFGVALCQRDGYWDALVVRWRDRLPMPSSSLADERAARASALYRDLSKVGDEDAAEEQKLAMLTQRARAELIRAGVVPGSRPELPRQLQRIGDAALARDLSDAIARRVA